MKLALISDIHGNLSALEAVLNDFETTAPDKTVLLGDVANFGPQPHETLARFRELDFPTVMGNTDASLLQPPTLEDIKNPTDDTLFFLAVEGWCAEQLTEDDRNYVRTFQPTIKLRCRRCFGAPLPRLAPLLQRHHQSDHARGDVRRVFCGRRSSSHGGRPHAHTTFATLQGWPAYQSGKRRAAFFVRSGCKGKGRGRQPALGGVRARRSRP